MLDHSFAWPDGALWKCVCAIFRVLLRSSCMHVIESCSGVEETRCWSVSSEPGLLQALVREWDSKVLLPTWVKLKSD